MNELVAVGAGFGTWAQAHPVAAGVLTVMTVAVAALPPFACWWLLRRTMAASRETVQSIDNRLSQLSTAVEMLTDTTEAGLQSAFSEIQRLLNNDIEQLTRQAGLQTRVHRAAQGGQTTREIAQREGVSEGEVHLRMVLNNKPSFLRQASRPAAAH